MPSFKTKKVFKSSWNALFWSAGTLLTAYCSVPHAGDKPSAHDNEAAEKLVKRFSHHRPAEHHGNPWAKPEK